MIFKRHRLRVLACSLLTLFAVSGLAATAAHATFPGENGRILFTLSHDDDLDFGDGEVFSVNFDGTDPRLVAGGMGQGENRLGRWSRDGQRISFLSDHEGRWGLFTTSDELSASHNREAAPYSPVNSASWTHDDRIVLLGNRTFDRINPGTHDPSEYLGESVEDAEEAGVAVSPNPSVARLAFSSDQEDPGVHSDIVVTDHDCTNELRLTRGFENYESHTQPSWSPDGQQIAYSSADKFGQVRTVQVIRADGTGTPRDITPAGFAGATSPVWSPDGTQMALAVGVGSPVRWRLAVINVDGSAFPEDGSLVHFVPLLTPTGSLYDIRPNAVPTDWQALPVGSRSVRSSAGGAGAAAPGTGVTSGSSGGVDAGSGSTGGSPALVSTPVVSVPPQVNPTLQRPAPSTATLQPPAPNANKTSTTPKILTLAKLSLTKRKFTAGQKKIHFLFTLTHKAAVQVTFKRAGEVVGMKGYQGKAGANRTLFNGAVKHQGKTKRLVPGKYVAFIVAKDSAGKKSSVKKISFRVLKKK